MATAAASNSIDATGEYAFRATNNGGSDGMAVRAYYVHNLASSGAAALVTVAGLHKADEFAGIEPGGTRTFIGPSGGIHSVYVKSASGSISIHHGVVAV